MEGKEEEGKGAHGGSSSQSARRHWPHPESKHPFAGWSSNNKTTRLAATLKALKQDKMHLNGPIFHSSLTHVPCVRLLYFQGYPVCVLGCLGCLNPYLPAHCSRHVPVSA